MKIVAIKPAFYGGRRVRTGDELDIPEGTKGSWFVKTGTSEAKAAKAVPVKETPKALSELGSSKAKTFNEVHKPDLA